MKKLFYYPEGVTDTMKFIKYLMASGLSFKTEHNESRFAIVDDEAVIEELEKFILERKEAKELVGKVVVQNLFSHS
jgi:alpha-D-ribose 1-methylphosphonate 5-triphosphate synthase subunit PhnH